MIFRGSRYENVAYTGIQDAECKIRRFLHDRRIYTQEDVGERAFEHTVVGQETLDSLAEQYYGKQSLWWLLADVNEIFFALAEVEPGTVLVIPEEDVVRELGLL